jgi:hypothetical protein
MNMILPGYVADARVIPELQLLRQVACEEIQGCANEPSLVHKILTFIGAIAAANSHRRKAFITRKGHLGRGPVDLKPGDVITLIGGADMPFVLRRDPNGMSRLIGEAYVDGMMDGEMISGEGGDMIELY